MNWLRRVRGAVGMGVAWAVGWALGGLMIGVASKLTPFFPWHYFFDVFDAPLPALSVPGFFAGAIFSLVLGVAGRGRRFSDLALAAFVGWGALAGLVLSLIPAVMVATSLASANGSIWQITAAFAVPGMLFGAVSALGTLKLARVSAKEEPAELIS